LGVFGFWEGIASARRTRQFTVHLKDVLDSERPDVFVPVSYAGANLELARHARARGIRVVYLSPPQLWAWGRWRAKALRAGADLVICLFPFEESFLRDRGINAVYLGNPLADELTPSIDNPEATSIHNLQSVISNHQSKPLLLLPGSRPTEIRRHLPLMLEVARRLQSDMPEITARIILPESIPVASLRGKGKGKESFDSSISNFQFPISNFQSSGPSTLTLTSTSASTRWQEMASAQAAIIASGTATLEAALLQLPMVVVYRLSTPSYLAAKALVRVPYFSLPNIILARSAVPELAQPHPRQVYEHISTLLKSAEARQAMRQELRQVREKLGPHGAAKRIAAAILGPL
jgi:lipid-A-disaccharide synthase